MIDPLSMRIYHSEILHAQSQLKKVGIINYPTHSMWWTFSPALSHTYVMLGGSATAWQRSSAFWDMLRVVFSGGMMMTGEPKQKQMKGLDKLEFPFYTVFF